MRRLIRKMVHVIMFGVMICLLFIIWIRAINYNFGIIQACATIIYFFYLVMLDFDKIMKDLMN